MRKVEDLGRSLRNRQAQETAIARVWIKPGTGKITVNGRDFVTYFARPVLQMVVQHAGLSGCPPGSVRRRLHPSPAAGPFRARPALCATASPRPADSIYEPGLRAVLKKGGFLTRDSRVVERKKYGKATGPPCSFQSSKR